MKAPPYQPLLRVGVGWFSNRMRLSWDLSVVDRFADEAATELTHHQAGQGSGSVGDLAEALCCARDARSAPFARACVESSKFDEEKLMGENAETLAGIVGIAVAAAVLAVVVVVRGGRKVSFAQRNVEPSADFRGLAVLAEGESEAAALAARIRSGVEAPWSWQLAEALDVLSVVDKRELLGALAGQNLCNVKGFAPKAGDEVDSSRMSTSRATTSDDVWVVKIDTPNGRQGYRVADRVVVLAEVDVCTVDWWVLSKTGCDVGSEIVARTDDFLVGGRAKAASWRAPWGFTFPEDLRKLPESDLDQWRRRLVAELNPHYRGRLDRQLALVGIPGEAFDSSMETETGLTPAGDAVVSEVVLRDGVPQYGLACPGGSPLLMAVVRIGPPGSGT